MTAANQEPAALPMGLRERVMAASLLARGAGQPVPAVPEISGAEAFDRAADAFYGLLCALAEEDWKKPALRGLDVKGLVGHLIGVEEDVQRGMAADPEVARADHVAVHGMRLTADALLVVRAFELWVHDNDIRSAVGLPPSVPDTPVLRLMSDLAARMLPFAAARTGLREPVDVHLVLTGPGGGTWQITVGQSPPEPVDVAIVTDAIGFCRLAGNRVSPAELDVHITGDCGRAADVLAATTALALD